MNKFLLAVLLMGSSFIQAQQLREPFDFTLLLSGNFGELRNNHFHSGLDFKTQGVEGKPVHAVQDGYVSRISINAWGYGYALYLDHPDGTTTVYGHLQRFAPEIAQYARNRQFEEEKLNIDESIPANKLPVKKGDIIAYSGNSGSSAGPHLHFEVRDTKTEDLIDPLDFFKDKLEDTKAPQIKGIMICPMVGEGVVNGKQTNFIPNLGNAKNGKRTITQRIEAWGDIGLAVKGVDVMDNTSNVYGVKEIILLQDEKEIFHSTLDRYGFHQTRYINSFIDFEKWKKGHQFYMRCYIEPGNKLPFMKAVRRGIIHIDEEKPYHFTYILKDHYGNSTSLSLQIHGKKQSIPSISYPGTELFHWNSENKFGAKGIRLSIPKGALYDDCHFIYSTTEKPLSASAWHTVHNSMTPIHIPAKLSLKIQNENNSNKRQYGIVQQKNGWNQWIGGTYRDGWIDASIKEFGTYGISEDTVAPKIAPVTPAQWMSRKTFTFVLSDDLSGIQTYKGKIDGEFVLFEMNNKSVIKYRLENERFKKGKHHTLVLTATDLVGNEQTYTYDFFY